MSEIIERQEEDHEPPVQHKTCGERGDECGDFKNAPPGFGNTQPFDVVENFARVIAEVRKENIRPRILRPAIMAMLVDGKWVDGPAVFIRQIRIPHVMTAMHRFVKYLRETHRHRFHDAEQPIENRRSEKPVVKKVMRYAVDVP